MHDKEKFKRDNNSRAKCPLGNHPGGNSACGRFLL